MSVAVLVLVNWSRLGMAVKPTQTRDHWEVFSLAHQALLIYLFLLLLLLLTGESWKVIPLSAASIYFSISRPSRKSSWNFFAGCQVTVGGWMDVGAEKIVIWIFFNPGLRKVLRWKSARSKKKICVIQHF